MTEEENVTENEVTNDTPVELQPEMQEEQAAKAQAMQGQAGP